MSFRPSQHQTWVLHPVERHADPAGKLVALAGLVVVVSSAVGRSFPGEVDAELLISPHQPGRGAFYVVLLAKNDGKGDREKENIVGTLQ